MSTFASSSRPSCLRGFFVVLLLLAQSAWSQTLYQQDVEFALEQIPQKCGALLKQKQIDWDAVSAQFREETRAVENDEQHLKLLVRLIARLKDGHASVRPLEKGKNVPYPNRWDRLTGPGMFWCIIDDKLHVKKSWGGALAAGVTPGMEIVAVDDQPARQWFDQKLAAWEDTGGHSTSQQSTAWMCHWGLAATVGSEMRLRVRDADGNERGCVIRYQRATYIPDGPAVWPNGLQGDNNLKSGKLASGCGYIHVRRTPADLPQKMDAALAAVGNVPGLILDLRGNGGGGFDHDALLGRFIPVGKRIEFAKAYGSAGPNPYGGPVVVIVDANCRSAGETLTAIFKDDGRAYVIGETPTAGTSSQKTTLDLPSGLFQLYFSTRSNMQRTSGGAGIEGVGVPPHEIVQYDPKHLAAGRDTLIEHAEKLLADFPQQKVAYNPSNYGWGNNSSQP